MECYRNHEYMCTSREHNDVQSTEPRRCECSYNHINLLGILKTQIKKDMKNNYVLFNFQKTTNEPNKQKQVDFWRCESNRYITTIYFFVSLVVYSEIYDNFGNPSTEF